MWVRQRHQELMAAICRSPKEKFKEKEGRWVRGWTSRLLRRKGQPGEMSVPDCNTRLHSGFQEPTEFPAFTISTPALLMPSETP